LVSKAVAGELVSKAVAGELVSKAVAGELVSKAVAGELVSDHPTVHPRIVEKYFSETLAVQKWVVKWKCFAKAPSSGVRIRH
jgi:hypothetical protein